MKPQWVLRNPKDFALLFWDYPSPGPEERGKKPIARGNELWARHSAFLDVFGNSTKVIDDFVRSWKRIVYRIT